MKRFALGGLAALLFVAAPAHAASPPPAQAELAQAPTADEDPGARIEEVLDAYDEAMSKFWESYQAAQDDDARAAVYAAHFPAPATYAARLHPLIEAHPTDPASLRAMLWVLDFAGGDGHAQEYRAWMLAHHRDSRGMVEACATLAGDASVENEAFLRRLVAESEARPVVGSAVFALASVLGTRLDVAEALRSGDADAREAYVGWVGEAVVALCTELDVEAVRAERKALLVRARDEFGEVSTPRGVLKTLAGGALFELEHLQIGMTAPDIVGADLDGVEFKLSDYRGQVVMLDFWGDW